MPKGVLVVETSPAEPGREAEYNEWYNGTHLKEVLELSGFTAARRFKRVEAAEGHPYLALYEVEADDLQAALAGLGVAAQSGKLNMSDALGMDPPPSMTLYEQIAQLDA